MSASVDRLIARVVDGRHDLRAPRPSSVESDATALEEWPGEVETEVVVSSPRRQPPSLVEPAASDTSAPAAVPRDGRITATGEPEPVFVRDAAPPLEPRNRDGEQRIPDLPATQLYDSRAQAVPRDPHEPAPVAQTVTAPVARRPSPPRRVVAAREEARRTVPSPASEQEQTLAPTEPDQITIDIGRIEVAGPTPAPRRMLTLDAYLAARRDGTR